MTEVISNHICYEGVPRSEHDVSSDRGFIRSLVWEGQSQLKAAPDDADILSSLRKQRKFV